MNESISVKQKKSLINIAKKYDLELLILFGSRAKNKANNNSDYDLAFYKKNSFKINDEINLFDEIEKILNYKSFDLINLKNNHNVILRQQIFQNGLCIYEKYKNLFNKEKDYAYFDYIDSFVLLEPNKKKFLSK